MDRPSDRPPERPSEDLIQIPDRMFFRIGEVSKILKLKPYVIRYWEKEFAFLRPTKNQAGQRVYGRTQVEGLSLVKRLLHIERYSIEGARKKIQELRLKPGAMKKEVEHKVLGGSEQIRARETLKKTHEVAVELRALLRRPIRDIFKS